MKERRLFNNTFNNGINRNFNACVGSNGWQDLDTYAKGYDENVQLIVKALSTSNLDVTLDAIIHPLVFSARHRIELFIKSHLRKIGLMRAELLISDEKIIRTHDLGHLWAILEERLSACDRRFSDFIDEVQEIIQDFAEIDPTGETFRYPYNKQNQRHLEQTPIINIGTFYKGYQKMSAAMKGFEYFTNELIDEYKLGTFTNKLSRFDLQQIATALPHYPEWGQSQFFIIKAEIINQYNVSSNDFSRALEVIKKHREFSELIGVPIDIDHVSLAKLAPYVDLHRKIYKGRIRDGSAFSHDEMIKAAIEDGLLATYIKNNLTIQEIATLHALEEHGSLNYYSEEFDFLQKDDIKQSFNEESFLEMINRLTMPNAILNIEKSLRKMRQNTLLSCF